MTYAFSWPLQQALFAALTADPEIAALAGGRVWDEAGMPGPAGAGDGPWVLIGDETVVPWSTATEIGAEHVLRIDVVGPAPGFAALKRVAAAVCAVATGPLALARGRIAGAGFLGGRTLREDKGRLRRIALRFRIVVEETA